MATTPLPDPNAQQLPPQPDPAVSRMQQELARQRAELDRMRVFTSTLQTQPQQPQGPGTDQHKELIKEFNKDPLSMTAAIAHRAAAEAVRQNGAAGFDTQVQMARQLARGTDSIRQARFDKFEGEVAAQMAKVDPQYHTNATMWQSAFDMVLGRHANDLIAEAQADPARGPAIKVTPGSGPSTTTKAAPATAGTAKDKITPEEHRIAVKFKITDDAYMRGKDRNARQSDEFTDPVGKSSWDEIMTFTTKDRKRRQREVANAKK